MTFKSILVYAVIAFIQSIGLSFVMFRQLSKKTSLIDKIKFILIMWIYGIISFAYIPNQLRFVMFIITIIFVLYFALKIRDKVVILYAFSTTMIFSISEILVSIALVLIGLNSTDIVNDLSTNLLTNILISSFAIILSFIPFIKNIISKLNSIFNKSKRITYYFIVLLIMVYIIVSKNGLEFILKSNYYINIVFVVGIALVIVIVFKSEARSEKLLEMNQQMLNYVTKYEKIITEQGKANHEFKNQLMVIRGYAQINSPKLIDYLDSIVDDIKKTHSSYLISNLNKFPDGGIKGLLYYKLSVMDDEKIVYDINVENGVKSKLNHLDTSSYKNITKILGVLLDNAIDASKKSKSKKIMIIVTCEKSVVSFKIYNSYKGKIEVSKIGTGYTTKGSGHGFGLRLVQDIIDNDSSLSVESFLENEYYVSVLNVKNTSKKNSSK